MQITSLVKLRYILGDHIYPRIKKIDSLKQKLTDFKGSPYSKPKMGKPKYEYYVFSYKIYLTTLIIGLLFLGFILLSNPSFIYEVSDYTGLIADYKDNFITLFVTLIIVLFINYLVKNVFSDLHINERRYSNNGIGIFLIVSLIVFRIGASENSSGVETVVLVFKYIFYLNLINILIAVIISVFINITEYKDAKSYLNTQLKNYNTNVKKIPDRIKEMKQELLVVTAEVAQLVTIAKNISVLHIDLWSIDRIDYCIKYFKYGMADSLKEALILYEDELHKRQLSEKVDQHYSDMRDFEKQKVELLSSQNRSIEDIGSGINNNLKQIKDEISNIDVNYNVYIDKYKI